MPLYQAVKKVNGRPNSCAGSDARKLYRKSTVVSVPARPSNTPAGKLSRLLCCRSITITASGDVAFVHQSARTAPSKLPPGPDTAGLAAW